MWRAFTLDGSLGIPWEANHEQIVERLHQCAAVAVPLLIAELRVVDPEAVTDPQWGHMVWCERALRSITGQYFEFRSDEDLGSLVEFRGPDDRLGFAMERMSNGKVYLAPRDVQRKVIHAWETWLGANHGKFSVADFEEFGEWFW